MLIFICLQVVLIFFLLFHFLGFAFSLLKSKPKQMTAKVEFDFACIITAYKNSQITYGLIDSILKQVHHSFHIYVVGDGCQANDFEKYRFCTQISLLIPEKSLNSKVKSLRFAKERLIRKHDFYIVLDPDNLLHPNCLAEINLFANQGFKAVQGKRLAKNLNTSFACLDAAGEYYYNFNSREIPFNLGSSATIAGSGMAIEKNYFEKYLNDNELVEKNGKVIIAEDKILQYNLVKNGLRIAYNPNALIYDEKVNDGNQVQRQRTRWISSYFKHLSHGISLLLHFNFNKFYFGLLLIYPPIFLMLIASMLFCLTDILIGNFLLAGCLLAGISVFFVHFIISLKVSKAPQVVINALLKAPFFISRQIAALFQLKKSAKDFMATTHTHAIGVDELVRS
jgi:cellulose synthase/poly-beta-1,6-N-acetylglucosamine synthase-like glycosyltransferase